MKQIKILIVDTVEFDLNGIASVILNYSGYLDDQDLCIDYVVINKPKPELACRLTDRNAGIYVIERKKSPISYVILLYRIMRKNKYDIVHVHGNSATMILEMSIARIAGIPIRIAHSHNTTCTHQKLHYVLFPFFKRLYTHGFACGQNAGKWLFHEGKFEVILNGIELEKFNLSIKVRDELRRRMGVDEYLLIGHVGNFVEQKNHMFLLDFFAELLKTRPACRMVLIGTGDMEQDLRQRSRRLGIEEYVCFVGRTSEVHKFLQAFDLFVLPSLYEGLPVSLLEAQAAGLPCFVSDTVSKQAGLTDLVRFLPLDDTGVWVDEVRRFQPDLEYRINNMRRYHEQIGHAGYDIQRNGKRLGTIYREYFEEYAKKSI